jgi:2-methylcitrate dehydratase PrpD
MSVTTAPDGATLELARILSGVSFAALPLALRARTLEAVHDALACAVGGARTDLALTHRAALGLQGDGATVIGAGRAAPGNAAWLNAVAINAMDYDDTARVSGHPGATVVAAALAAAEMTKADGATFLSGLVAGYEAAFRVALACRPSPERYAEVHGSQCFLPFGAAAAAGRILSLDAEQMARALGLAGAMAPVPAAGKFGFDEPQLSWLKDNVHQPAETGLRAALLAREGMPASRTLLTGPKGWWRMIASDRFEESDLLGTELLGVAELAFKPWPCCRWLHAAMDAACLAYDAAARMPELPVAIRLDTVAMVAAVFGNRRPATMVDAQFSAPHALATLLRRVPATRWWQRETREDTEAQGLMDSVTLATDPVLDAAFLAGGRNVNRLPARVTLRFADGAEHAALVDYPMGAPGRPQRGQPDDPLDEAGHMAAKRRDLLALALDRPGIAAFEAVLAALPGAADVASLVRPLAPR